MLNIHLYSLTSSSSSLFFTTIISVTCLFTGFLSLSPPSVSLQVSRPPAARILASDKASMLEFDLPRTQARKHANQAFKSLLCRTAQSPQKVQSTTKSAPKEEKGTDKREPGNVLASPQENSTAADSTENESTSRTRRLWQRHEI